MPPKLIATYSRVSTARQEDEHTIKNQLEALNEYAINNNLQIVKQYTDEGWSGDILARPALDELRQDVKAKIWSAVLIYDPDRLARRYSYQELVMDELKESGIEVLFITVSTPKNSEDKILHGVRGLFAEYERAKISERFRLGKLRKLREGHILVSEALYGYTYISKKDKVHGYYQINESEAKVVRLIFSWIDKEGLTLRKVVVRLLELGIQPRRSKRGVWNTSTLSSLLSNKTYIGEAHWGSSYAVVPEKPLKNEKYKKMKKSSRRVRPESEWIIVPVPPIIEKEQFERVQQRMKANFTFCARNKRNEYFLAGLIWCTCGRRRGGEGPKKGRYLYYRCTSRVYSFPLKSNCNENGINARMLDEVVWNALVEVMSSPKTLLEQAKRFIQDFKRPTQQTNIEVVEEELKKLNNQIERYNKAYAAELITIQQLASYVNPLKARIIELKTALSREKQNLAKNAMIMPTEEQIGSFATSASELLLNLNFEQKKAIIMHAVDKVVVAKENLSIYGNIPIIKLKHVEMLTNHRNRWESFQHMVPTIPFMFDIDLEENSKKYRTIHVA